jgi:hypothetical protein
VAACPDPVASKLVIVNQFFALSNAAEAYEPQSTAPPSDGQIGFAAVIDELGPAASDRTVYRPVCVELSEVVQAAVWAPGNLEKPAPSLSARDFLAGIFDYPRSGWDLGTCEYAKPMDARLTHAQTERRSPADTPLGVSGQIFKARLGHRMPRGCRSADRATAMARGGRLRVCSLLLQRDRLASFYFFFRVVVLLSRLARLSFLAISSSFKGSRTSHDCAQIIGHLHKARPSKEAPSNITT